MAEAYTVSKLSPLRKIIAARMTDAKRTIPHFRASVDLQVDSLIKLRGDLRAKEPESPLSLNDLIIKACAAALMEVPAINIQWADSEIHQLHSADISIVTALQGGGLATPIVRAANLKSIWEISREVRELSARAVSNALRMDEVFGGSFSISNLGMYGVDEFDAIINSPQCAILAVACAKPQAIVSREQQVTVATLMRATLSVDHRALDGTTAALFLAALRRHVEQPAHLVAAPPPS